MKLELSKLDAARILYRTLPSGLAELLQGRIAKYFVGVDPFEIEWERLLKFQELQRGWNAGYLSYSDLRKRLMDELYEQS